MPRNPLDFLPASACAVLDVGCHVGETVGAIARRGVPRVRGIDINPNAIETAKANFAALPNAEFSHATGDNLPYGDSEFDAVTCFEVLEHVPSELRKGVLKEVCRVLRPGGRLIMTVPHRGLFAALDPENMRFRIPALYRLMSRWVGGKGKEIGYEGQKHGVVFHYHFTLKELSALLCPDFSITRVFGRGLIIAPIGYWLRWPFYRWRRRDNLICRMIESTIRLEGMVPMPLAVAYNVVVIAEKTGTSASSSSV